MMNVNLFLKGFWAMPSNKAYAFIWVYNTLMLKFRISLSRIEIVPWCFDTTNKFVEDCNITKL
jgi:hypothetical protein